VIRLVASFQVAAISSTSAAYRRPATSRSVAAQPTWRVLASSSGRRWYGASIQLRTPSSWAAGMPVAVVTSSYW
jgi:hypothetical protein